MNSEASYSDFLYYCHFSSGSYSCWTDQHWLTSPITGLRNGAIAHYARSSSW